jgi:hypothetical protein
MRRASRVSGTRADTTVIMKIMAGDVASLTSTDDPRYMLDGHEVAFLRQLIAAPDSIANRALNRASRGGRVCA